MPLCSSELLLWFHLFLVAELCGQFLDPAMNSAVLLGASSHSSPCAPCPIPRKRGFCGPLLSPPQTAFSSPPRQLSNPPKMVTASLAEVLWAPQLLLPQAFCLPEVLLMLVVLVVPKVLQLLAVFVVVVGEVEGEPFFHFGPFWHFASPGCLSPTASLSFSPVIFGTSSFLALLVPGAHLFQLLLDVQHLQPLLDARLLLGVRRLLGVVHHPA